METRWNRSSLACPGRPVNAAASHVAEQGDLGNTLSRAEIEDKALRLAAYRGGASAAEMRRVIALVWGMAENPRVPVFLG